MAIEIERLRSRDLDDAAAALTRAFQDDPGFNHVWPDPDQRARALTPFLRLALKDALPFGHTYAAYEEGRVVGTAAWLPPGAYPMSKRRQLASTPGILRSMAAAPSSFPTLMRLGQRLEQAFPKTPVWYLVVVGVAPEAARAGVGTRLLEPELRARDEDGGRCYLETGSEPNVRWYERLGFAVEDASLDVLDGGPTYWTMRRP